jgi:type I site-specific restriction endonuclease
MPSSTPTEAQTRRTLIDDALLRVGWNPADRTLVGQEIPVDGFSPQAWQELERQLRERSLPAGTPLPAGISDYVLYRTNGEILAVVEAKRSSVNALIAETQAEFYARELG